MDRMASADWSHNSQEDMQRFCCWYLKRYNRESGDIYSLLHPHFLLCNYEERSLTVFIHVKDWALNPEGTMHGGLISTVFDGTFGTLCHYWGKQRFITTVSLSTTFLKPVRAGDTLEVTAHATSIGRTLMSMIAEGRTQDGAVLAATAFTTFMFLDKEFPDDSWRPGAEPPIPCPQVHLPAKPLDPH